MDFRAAASWLSSQRKQCFGETVTYSRGADFVEIVVSRAGRPPDVDERTGAVDSAERVDWQIAAADLVLAGQAVTPQDDDEIEVTGDGMRKTYRVLPSPGVASAERLAGQESAWLVRTKLVSSELV